MASLFLIIIGVLSAKYSFYPTSQLKSNTKIDVHSDMPVVVTKYVNHPNFVFLLIDDMGYGTIGYFVKD